MLFLSDALKWSWWINFAFRFLRTFSIAKCNCYPQAELIGSNIVLFLKDFDQIFHLFLLIFFNMSLEMLVLVDFIRFYMFKNWVMKLDLIVFVEFQDLSYAAFNKIFRFFTIILKNQNSYVLKWVQSFCRCSARTAWCASFVRSWGRPSFFGWWCADLWSFLLFSFCTGTCKRQIVITQGFKWVFWGNFYSLRVVFAWSLIFLIKIDKENVKISENNKFMIVHFLYN